MNHDPQCVEYADDGNTSVGKLMKIRLPSLLIGLQLGLVISFLMSGFERVLSEHVQVAFFLPFVVYMADAVGTQTQCIYCRALGDVGTRFSAYLLKELALGIILGAGFGLVTGLIALLWLGDMRLALSVGLSVLAVIATAPLVGLFITQAMQYMRSDPAASAGPIATVLQDMLSVLIYGSICSAML